MIKFPCVFAVFIALICSGCATGSHVITGKARPAITPAAVAVLNEYPVGGEVIGIVTADVSRTAITVQGATDRALERLKVEAGKIGANAIMIQNSGIRPPSYGDSGSVTLSAQAFFVP